MTRLFHVPKPPLNYLPRPDQLGSLVTLVLSDRTEAIGVVGVQGMGGIGKSVLAAAAAGEKRVHKRFKDGIYWLTVSQSPDMVAIQRQLARDLGVPLNEIQFLDAALGRSELENRLTGKAVLLVLDDVWQMEHAEQLDVVRPPGRVLITTHSLSVLQGLGATVHRVDLLSPDKSLEVLAEWAGQKRRSLPPEAAEVASECGYLPLALAMVGAMIQRRPTAWPDALVRLQQHDLAKLETRFAGYPHPHLLRAIETSVDGLDDKGLTSRFGRDVRQRYLELAVFPEDELIPEAALAVLWGAAGLDQADVGDLMDEFVARSLAQSASGTATSDVDTAPAAPHPARSAKAARRKTPVPSRTGSAETAVSQTFIRLHDLQADYVLAACGDVGALHGQLVDAYAARSRDGFARGPDDGYYFQHLGYHLVQAGRHADLRHLLCQADWLQAHLAATDPVALIGGFRWLEQDEGAVPRPAPETGGAARGTRRRDPREPDRQLRELRMLRDAIRLSAHVLVNDPAQLSGQLLGRLDGGEYRTLKPLLGELAEAHDKPLLRPLTCSLHPPGTALLRTLTGHTDGVLAVAVTPDGRRAISASYDQTLRVWDLETGKTLAAFTGDGGIGCCAVAPDGVTFLAGEASGRVHFLGLVEPQPAGERKKRIRDLRFERGKAKRVKKPARDQVFISYSHEDRAWLQRLQKHLKPYVRNATIAVWDDTQIKTGTKWRDEIAAALAAARVGVLLVSPDFLASDFIADKELPPLFSAAKKDGLTIVWVPISASAYKKTPIADFQAAYDPASPLDSLSEAQQNKALVEICEKIEAAYSGS